MAKLTLNGKVIDLDAALPLRIKDWKALKAKHNVTPEQLGSSNNFEALSVVVWYAANKVDNTITQDMVDELTLGEMMDAFLNTQKDVIDRPFLTPSTTSQASTDGAETT